MLGVRLICVGKMKERHFIEAMKEYEKRLGGFCRLEIAEIPEHRLSAAPGDAEIRDGIEKEAEAIRKHLDKGAYVIAMCIEGKTLDSERFARFLELRATEGASRLCFVIGGSHGLCEDIKKEAHFRLSMSPMTFPHHLARVMLAEQIYRGFMINQGTRYHK